MPRQNRVTPFGTIVAIPERGLFMGNRGVLHDPDGRIRRPWQLKRWLICLLEFRGRSRQVMKPDRYTELFFLDEATALAAGHRPCFECRRPDYLRYQSAWRSDPSGPLPTAPEIDDLLHAERINPIPSKTKRTYRHALDALPDGVLVTRADDPVAPLLIWRGGLHAWSPSGYGRRSDRSPGEVVVVLTPPSTVRAIASGYVPAVHPSAR